MKKIFIAVVVLIVVGYGAYIYRDRFWEKSVEEERNYTSNFSNSIDSDKDSRTALDGINVDGEAGNQASGQANEAFPEANREETDSQAANDQDARDQEDLNCEDKAVEDRNQCFKDKALRDKDDGLCNKITDENLKNNCVNLVAEEILEGL